MIARDAVARAIANSLFDAYIVEVCDADLRTKHSHECDWSLRDFVQAGVDDDGIYEDCDRMGINIFEDNHFIPLVLHHLQVEGVRV